MAPYAVNQLATVSVPEPRLLSVCGPSMVPAVRRSSLINLAPATEGLVLRLNSGLNQDRHKGDVEDCAQICRAARVAVRHVHRIKMISEET
jgi:ribosome recycling factor